MSFSILTTGGEIFRTGHGIGKGSSIIKSTPEDRAIFTLAHLFTIAGSPRWIKFPLITYSIVGTAYF